MRPAKEEHLAAPNWPPNATPQPSLLPALGALAALIVAAATARGSLRCGAKGSMPQGFMALAALALLCAVAADVAMISGVVPSPTQHALGATAAALLGYVVVQAAIGFLFLLSNFLRVSAGFVLQRRLIDLR